MVVGIYKRQALVLLEVVVEKPLCVHYAFKTAEALQMRFAHVGDKAVGGLGYLQQRPKVFRMAGSHLHNCNLDILANSKNRQGHSDVVVEVSAGGGNLVLCGQDRAHKLLGGGFSVCAGKADNRNVQLRAVERGKLLEGLKGVFNLDEPGVFFRYSVVDHGIAGASFKGLERKGVAVKILSLKGKEKLVFRDCAGVGVYSGTLKEYLV